MSEFVYRNPHDPGATAFNLESDMTAHYPVVIEREDTGVFSAYVPGLPVYAQESTRTEVERVIGQVLAAYLQEHPDPKGTPDPTPGHD